MYSPAQRGVYDVYCGATRLHYYIWYTWAMYGKSIILVHLVRSARIWCLADTRKPDFTCVLFGSPGLHGFICRVRGSHICGANINAVLCIYQRCLFRPPPPPGVSSGLYKQINTINVTCIFHLRIIVNQAYT